MLGPSAAALGRVLASVADANELRKRIFLEDPLITAPDHKLFARALLALGVVGFPQA